MKTNKVIVVLITSLVFGWKGIYPLNALAAGYFALFTMLGYIVYISKKDKS